MGGAACSGDGEGGAPEAATNDTPLAAAFARVPASLADGGVRFSNFAAATDVERPEPGDTAQDIAYARALADAGVSAVGLELGDDQSEFESAYGFRFSTIDFVVTAGGTDEGVLLIGGAFDEAAIDDALGANAAQPERTERGGATIWRWPGEDLELRSESDVLDLLGRPLRFAVWDDLIARTVSTDVLDAVVDGALPLSEHETVGPILDALLAEGAYTGSINTEPMTLQVLLTSPLSETTDELEAEIGDLVLAEFDAFGVGMTSPDQMVVVYGHRDDGAAAENEDRLEALLADGTEVATGVPWSEIFESSEVERDGRVVIARLAVDTPLRWIEMVMRRSSLFVYDETS